MNKRIFIGFTLFALLFTLVAWQYAEAELVELREEPDPVEKELAEKV